MKKKFFLITNSRFIITFLAICYFAFFLRNLLKQIYTFIYIVFYS